MSSKEVFYKIRFALVIILIIAVILRIPYLGISTTFAFDWDKGAGMIIWSILDILTTMVAVPVFYTIYGRGFFIVAIAVLVALTAIVSQIVVVFYQLENRDNWNDPPFHEFYCSFSYTLNILFIAFGFVLPVVLIFASSINMNGIKVDQREENMNYVQEQQIISETSEGKIALE